VQSVSQPAGSGACLGHYLRPVNALLLFSDGSVLLVSEREADALQVITMEVACKYCYDAQ